MRTTQRHPKNKQTMFGTTKSNTTEYYNFVKPKLERLIELLEKELAQKEPEIMDYLTSNFKVLKDNDVLVESFVSTYLIDFWVWSHEKKDYVFDRETWEATKERNKKTQYEMALKLDPNFDEKKWDKIMNFKLPPHLEEKVYLYLSMLCDVYIAFNPEAKPPKPNKE